MQAQKRWGEGRFLPMVMLSQEAVNSVQVCFELIKLARRQSLLTWDADRKISRKAWNLLYRRSFSLEAVLFRFATTPEAEPDDAMADEYRQVRNEWTTSLRQVLEKSLTGKLTERERSNSERWVRRYYCWVHLPSLSRWTRGEEDHPPASWRAWLGTPEFLFFMGVVAPCMLEFQTTPWKLYRAATRGDFQSLEKLVRLDPQILTEERIADWYFRMQSNNAEGVELLRKAQTERITAQVKLASLKYLIGGWLMHVSQQWQQWLDGEVMFEIFQTRSTPEKLPGVLKWIEYQRAKVSRNKSHCQLTAPAISDLFHALAEDSGGGRFDPDFHKAKKTIYRRLERNAALWPELQKGNKTRAA